MTRHIWAIPVLVLVVITTLIAFPILTYPLGRDQGVFATMGQGIVEGQLPYKDLWDFKPPAIYYVYALFIKLFDTSVWSVRIIDLCIVPLTTLILFGIGRLAGTYKTGVLSLVAFPAFYFRESFWTLTQSDGVVLLPMILVVACILKASRDQSNAWRWAGLAGGISVSILLFKYPFVLFIFALIFAYIFSHIQTHRSPKALFKDGLAFVVGGLVIGLGSVGYFASVGILDDLIDSAQLASEYSRQSYTLREFMDSPVWRQAINDHWSNWKPLWIATMLWPFTWFFWRRGQHFIQNGWLTIWCWLVGGVAILIIQAKGYDYHWLPILPPLVLIACDAITRLIEGIGFALERILIPVNRKFWQKAATCLLIIYLLNTMFLDIWRPAWPYLSGKQNQTTYYTEFRGGEFVANESQDVATYLQRHTEPGDALYIWGFRPEIYYLSQLRPATRFISQFPLVAGWYPKAWQQENVEVLWATLPKYVLVLQVDYMPWMTGSDEDSNALLQDYVELNNWLIYNYERETQIGNFFIWRLKTTRSN